MDRLEIVKQRLSNLGDLAIDNPIVVDLKWAVEEIERLQAIVAKLPKTADGVPVVPGMTLFINPTGGGPPFPVNVVAGAVRIRYPVDGEESSDRASRYYSTPEAATAALEATQ